MASVARLVDRMEDQGWALWTRRPGLGAYAQHCAAWPSLARAAYHPLTQLGPQSPGLLTALADLSRQPAHGKPDAAVQELGMIYGATGDLLATLAAGIEHAPATSRARLSARLQATLHVAARATIATARRDGHAPDAAWACLERLEQATELAALLPPEARTGALELLTTSHRGADTFSGAVRGWAREAETVLSGDTQLTGYALQSSALVIASLCDRAARVVEQADGATLNREAAGALRRCSEDWRRAAAWPEHIRLGGRSADLRHATTALARQLEKSFRPVVKHRDLLDLQAAIHRADVVGTLHAASMQDLSTRRQLWVAVAALPAHYQATHDELRRSQWVTEPAGRDDSRHLAALSHTAHTQLGMAAAFLGAAVRQTMASAIQPQPVWEAVITPSGSPTAERVRRIAGGEFAWGPRP